MKPGVHHAEYMLLPRLAAMSEVAWATERRDYDDFVRRLGTLRGLYDLISFVAVVHVM